MKFSEDFKKNFLIKLGWEIDFIEVEVASGAYHNEIEYYTRKRAIAKNKSQSVYCGYIDDVFEQEFPKWILSKI